jgi:tRNA threonylcarbamoyladenosine biosynthesis protein TsaE
MGKTTFARGFVQALVPGLSNVTSPSFTLVNVYEAVLADGTKCPLWHVDLYRLKDASELPQLALEDAFDTAILLVEWPDMADSILPQERLRLEFRATDAFDTREIVATGGAFLHRLNG